VRIDAAEKSVLLRAASGADEVCTYDRLVIGTGAVPIERPIKGIREECVHRIRAVVGR
jgi:NADPH-dependent 2,4-dienoyl-CoA reductase/sulfur reductase-like enzyme